MNSLTVILPIPSPKLSPNARLHWAQKSKLVREHRLRAMIVARVALDLREPPMWGKCRMHVKVFTKTKRRPDPDNFMSMLKSYNDGFADAGVVQNDKDLWPERPEFFTDKFAPRVEITIIPE